MSSDDQQIVELVNLIDALYTERDASKIASIQTYLQNIQKSKDGIRLADILLSKPEYSLNCKFFGALTYTVNLTLYKSDHSKLDINSILPKLLFHLTSFVNNYRFHNVSNILIIKKLFQCLSIIYNSYPVEHEQWKAPFSCLLQILLGNKEPENIIQPLEINQYLPNIMADNASIQLLLTFSSIIVEDLTRIGTDKQDVVLHETTQLFVYKPTKALLVSCFQSNNKIIQKAALECLGSWIQYISFTLHATTLRFNDLNEVLQFLIILLTNNSTDSDIFQNVLVILSDIFENNPNLFSIELRNQYTELVSSDWPTVKINEYFQNEDFDNLESFVAVILSFLEIDQIKFASNIFKKENSKLMTFLLNLTNLPLKPIIEESVSKKFTEFWCKISEIFNDEFDALKLLLKEDEQLIQEITTNSKNAFGEISKIYFNKISLSIINDEEFKANAPEFFSFRDDLTELFDSIYSNLGPSLYENLVNNIINNQDLNQMETSLFLLTSISYNFSNITSANPMLNALDVLFSSDFLNSYNNLIINTIPEANREVYAKTSIRFLGSAGFFYQFEPVGGKYLNLVIDYLFNCLKIFPTQQSSASKVIMQLSDDCRQQLTPMITKFEPILVDIIKDQSMNPYTREKLINSISCIIQSIPNPAVQLGHVSQIIELIEVSSQAYLVQASSNTLDEDGFNYLISLFGCVLEVAKGLQIPEDFENERTPLFNEFRQFYQQSPAELVQIQDRLSKFVNIFAIEVDFLSANSQVNETATQIYKVGLLEDFGPFSFSSSTVLHYCVKKLQKSTANTYAFLLELLTTLFNVGLRQKSSAHQQIVDSDVTNVLNTFIIDKWSVVEEDPDLVQHSITLFSSLVSNKPAFFIHDTESFQFIVKTSISLLYSKEKFIIKAVSKFWTSLLSAKKVTAEESDILKSFFENDIGAFLTYTVFNTLIDASRSDIESYGNIVVLLLVKHPLKFNHWARDALEKINLERINSGASEIQGREIFVKQLSVTRGSVRKCIDLIKNFWISVNGLVSYN